MCALVQSYTFQTFVLLVKILYTKYYFFFLSFYFVFKVDQYWRNQGGEYFY